MHATGAEDPRSRLEWLERRVGDLERENQLLLRDQRETVRHLVAQLPIGAALIEDNYLHLNLEAERVLGYPTSELPTLREWFDRVHLARTSEFKTLYLAESEATRSNPWIMPLVRKDGEERLVELSICRWIPRCPALELWLLRDVTEALRTARLLEQTAQATQVGGWEVDSRTRHLYWTSETYRIHEVTPETYTPTVDTAIRFYTPESVPQITEAVTRCLTLGEPFDLELEIVTARNNPIWVRSIGVAERQGNETIRIYGSFQNITERRRSQEALHRSEGQKRRLLESSPDCLLEIEREGQIQYINPRGLELLEAESPEAVLGKHWRDLWPVESHSLLEEAIAQANQGQDTRLQCLGTTLRGHSLWWDVHVTAIHPALPGRTNIERLLVSARDITALKHDEIERQEFHRNLQETQKLESLGVLAGGIAHDFNNLLTSILGNVDLLRYFSQPNSPGTENLDQIERAAERAADLCRQMLAYAGKGKLMVEPVDLGILIAETTQLLNASLSKKSVLKVSVPRGLPFLLADATQIRQVLLNLVTNASEALGDEEGMITITVSHQHLDPDQLWGAQVLGTLPSGDCVCLEVADTGCGMDANTQARIFEPFFTTKFTGRGLGLSAVLGIVRSHFGSLQVQSAPGQGTTFRLYFPAKLGKEPTPEPHAHIWSRWQGSGLVMLVDDEDSVREVTHSLLRSFGFEVVEARDGWEAVSHLGNHGGQIRLVLLDWTMPRMNGEQTLQQLRQVLPGLPVVLMSGFSEREISARMGHLPPAGFLRKPFSREHLETVLRQGLGE